MGEGDLSFYNEVYMNHFDLPIGKNKLGTDPVTTLYEVLGTAFPDLALTEDNSKILKIQPAVQKEYPTRTYLLIQKGDDPNDRFVFYYDRHDINDFLVNPIFTKTEAEQAAAQPSSVKLLEQIANKYNLNLTEDDFWTSISSLDLSGGTNPPNWYMESVYDSIYWCGNMYVQLHNDTQTTDPD